VPPPKTPDIFIPVCHHPATGSSGPGLRSPPPPKGAVIDSLLEDPAGAPAPSSP
jgi:hypothetical protein